LIEDVGYTFISISCPTVAYHRSIALICCQWRKTIPLRRHRRPDVVIIVPDDTRIDRLVRLLWQVSTPPGGLAARFLKELPLFNVAVLRIGWL
jgi:hypothetical protein